MPEWLTLSFEMTPPDQIDLARVSAFRLGPITVEPALRQITAAQSETLEPRVMQVLVVLAMANGAIVSRYDLVRQCWEGRIVGDDSINRVIARLRKVAEDHGDGALRIETITKVGYRLIGNVTLVPSTAPLPLAIYSASHSVAMLRDVAKAPVTIAGPPPLPARLVARGTPVVSGRAAEQAILTRAWTSSAAGRGQVVLLGGEPGIGKTFLVAEVGRNAHAEGATVLFGHCDEDVPLPYRPFADACRHAVVHATDDLLGRYVERYHGDLARLVPELHDRVGVLHPPRAAEAAAERYLLFEAVVGLVAMIAELAPVVLVLDDLHWGSASDLQLLKHIVRAAPDLRLLIIGTFRDSDIGADHSLTSLLADLRREDHVHRCMLTGIDETAIAAMLTAHAGHPLGDSGTALAHAMFRDTAGNPFFITELLRHLAETGAIEREDARWVYRGDLTKLGVPRGVREVIARRVGRLAAAHAAVLGWAAIIGREFGLDDIESAAGDVGCDALDALDAAIAAGLVADVPRERDRFRFNHVLVRVTLYDGIGASRRRRMHRRVADVLAALPVAEQNQRIDDLAYHWLAGAEAADIDQAVSFARRAGARAAERLAYETAAGHYAQALAVLRPLDVDGERLKCDLLLDLGIMQRNVADAAFRTTMAEAAALAGKLGDADRLAQAALGSGHPGGLQWGNAVDNGLVALYTAALDALGPADSLLRVRLTGQLATELRFGPERERRHTLTAEALAMARRLADPATLAQALSARIFAVDDPTTLAERLAITAELEALADMLDNAELGCLVASQRFDALVEVGDSAAAAAAIRRCDARAAQLQTPFFRLVPRLLHTMWALMRAEPDAEKQVFATFAAARAAGLPHATNIAGSQLFELRARQGRLGEMLDSIRAAVMAFPDMVAMRAGLVFALTETGDDAEAQALLDDFVGDGSDLPMDTNWASAAFMLAEAAAALGDRRIAAMLEAPVTALAGQLSKSAGVRCDGSFAHSAGQIAVCLGRLDEARGHFETAIAVNDRVGAPAAAVRSRRALAVMLAGGGGAADVAHAGELATTALRAAKTLGLATETTRLSALLGRIGGPAAV